MNTSFNNQQINFSISAKNKRGRRNELDHSRELIDTNIVSPGQIELEIGRGSKDNGDNGNPQGIRDGEARSGMVDLVCVLLAIDCW